MTRFYDRALLDSVDQAKGLPDDERVYQIVKAVVAYTNSFSRNPNPDVSPGPPIEMEIRCAKADYLRWSRSHGLPDIGWDNLGKQHQWSHIEAVRPIIRAMRDPTREMMDAGTAAVGRGMLSPDSSFAHGAAYDCWISMIDAASPPTQTNGDRVMNVPVQDYLVDALINRIKNPTDRDDPGRYAIALGLFALAAEVRQFTRMTGEIAAKVMDDQ